MEDKEKEEFILFVKNNLLNPDNFSKVTLIVIQDIYLFIQRMSGTDIREFDKLMELFKGEVEPENGVLNRQKDDAIRKIYLWELMRQWNEKKSNVTMTSNEQKEKSRR